MRPQVISRAAKDVLSVCGTACPADAARWLISLGAHLPVCAKISSLSPADSAWAHHGAQFRTCTGAVVSLPGAYTAGAREMYCQNVYLRTGLTMPDSGWVIDLGANRGLFSTWAAMTGAQTVAVEAQQGFAPLIAELAAHNGVTGRVHVETATASGVLMSGAAVGVMADDVRWVTTSHGLGRRPADVSMPGLMSKYAIGYVDLLKVDIEGGEFALFGRGEDLHWVDQVGQIVLEVHTSHGNAVAMVRRLRDAGFHVDLCDSDGRSTADTSPQLAYAYCSR